MHQHSKHCNHNHSLKINKISKKKIRLLLIVLSLVFVFSLTEIWISFISNSLALLAEAGHLISDSFSLGIAIAATWIAHKYKQKSKVYSLEENQNHPVEIVAALINGIILIMISFWIIWEGINRINNPSLDILSLPMLITAIVGLTINIINIKLLHEDSHNDLNLKGVSLHIMADAASSVGVILAAIAVWWKGWYWADWGISLLVATLIFISAIPLVIESIKSLNKNSQTYKLIR